MQHTSIEMDKLQSIFNAKIEANSKKPTLIRKSRSNETVKASNTSAVTCDSKSEAPDIILEEHSQMKSKNIVPIVISCKDEQDLNTNKVSCINSDSSIKNCNEEKSSHVTEVLNKSNSGDVVEIVDLTKSSPSSETGTKLTNSLGNDEVNNSKIPEKKKKHTPITFTSEDIAQIKASIESSSSNSQATARVCSVCGIPLSKKSFVPHVSGKKHKTKERKQKRSKAQKEDIDRRTLHISGFDVNKDLTEVAEFYFDYGLCDMISCGNYFFFIFSSLNNALAALNVKYFTKSGYQVIAKRRNPRRHVDDFIAEKDAPFELSARVLERISAVPSSQEHLTESVFCVIKDIELTREERLDRDSIIERMESFLRREFHRVACFIFGSTNNNLGFRGADVDMYADLGYDPYNTPKQADGEAAAARLTTHLSNKLKREPWVQQSIAIPRARVPIVKLKISQIEVDLSFRNRMPLCNTALIRLFCGCHPLVRPYMMIVRLWAKLQMVAGGGRPSSHLTNYALTMLMAFVLMRGRKVLPSVVDLRRQHYQRIIINGWNCGFGERVDGYWNKPHSCSPLQLALEFFEFYADFDFGGNVICPLIGNTVTREAMKSKSLKILPQKLRDYVKAPSNLQTDTPICVQDPFDLGHNLTRGLLTSPLDRFQKLCRGSAAILKQILDLKAPLWSLFESVEIEEKQLLGEGEKDANLANETDNSVVEEVDAPMNGSETLDEVTIVDEVFPSTSKDGPAVVSKKRQSSLIEVAAPILPNVLVSDIELSNEDSRYIMQALDQNESLLTLHIDPFLHFQISDMCTGDIIRMKGSHNVDSIRKVFLQTIMFMFGKVFSADSLSRADISGQSSSKRQRPDNNIQSPVNCIAKFHASNVHVPVKMKKNAKMKIILPHLTPSTKKTISPFTVDYLVSQRIINKQPVVSSTTFFVCHNQEKLSKCVIIPDMRGLNKGMKEKVQNFYMNAYGCLNTCIISAIDLVRGNSLPYASS